MKVRRILFRIVYWLAVLAISIVLLILLVNWFESRDESQLGNGTISVPGRMSDLAHSGLLP